MQWYRTLLYLPLQSPSAPNYRQLTKRRIQEWCARMWTYTVDTDAGDQPSKSSQTRAHPSNSTQKPSQAQPKIGASKQTLPQPHPRRVAKRLTPSHKHYPHHRIIIPTATLINHTVNHLSTEANTSRERDKTPGKIIPYGIPHLTHQASNAVIHTQAGQRTVPSYQTVHKNKSLLRLNNGCIQ